MVVVQAKPLVGCLIQYLTQFLSTPETQGGNIEPENIARVRNRPDVTILNSLFGLCIFVFFVFLSFCPFVFLSGHHADQMSGGSQVSKVTLYVEIQKWQRPSH